MKKNTGLFLIPAVALAIGLTSAISLFKANKEVRDAHIIVQLKGSVDNKSYQTILDEQRQAVYYIRSVVTNNVKVTEHYSTLVNAFSLEVNSKYVDQIRHIPGVKGVTYDDVIATNTVDERDMERMQLAVVNALENNISAETMNVPNNTKKGEGVLIAVLDDGFLINASYKDGDNTLYTTHAAYTDLESGVATKVTQASIKSIVDSNPSFHGRYDAQHSTYLNKKVPFYYDYGGDSNSRTEDYDVFYASSSHGTHTSSIAASNDPNYPGIAPKAQLLLMKAATTTASSNGFATSAVVKALEDAYLLNADVISMSFGSALAETNHENIAVQAITKLKQKGVLMNVAAGNEGKGVYNGSAYENWSTDLVETGILGGTTSYKEVMSIASGQPDKLFFDTALVVDGKNIPFYDQIVDYKSTSGDVHYTTQRHMTDLLQLPGHSDGKFDWVKIPGLGKLSDFATVGKDNVKGKIAVIDRGDITFKEKIENSISYEAIAVAIIDNDFTATEFNFRMALQNDDGSVWTPSVPVCSILNRNKINFGDAGTLGSCDLLNNAIVNNPDVDTMSDFSSDGVLADLTIKPEITAPGTSILGAVYNAQDPSSNNTYDYYSGTSMATPNYSGALAVMLSEHLGDANYAKTLNRRMMSTAHPLVDRYGTNFDSVRRQGAGMVDVGAALNTKVVLDGSSDVDNLSNMAKVELGNNDDIKNGRINLNFTAVSEETSAVTYHAKAYIYRPAVANKLSEENYGERLANADFIATYDELITTVEKDVTINPGNTAINISATLSDEAKQQINGIFENGCVIEGYVVLTATDKEEISLPFLGFYGDYANISPVEPFSFEKDPNKVYTSELLENICSRWFGNDKAQFASNMLVGYYSDLNALVSAFNTYVNNTSKLTDFSDNNNKTLSEATYNPLTKEYGDTIYAGNNGASNTIVISQFVTRTVKNNEITIVNKATHEVALTTHLYDTFYGATYDGTTEVAWPLYKSYLDVNYYDSYIAHRARAFVPLYQTTYNPISGKYTAGEQLPSGDYELKLSYELAAGGTFEKKYNLVIDNDAPAISSIETVKDGGKTFLRVRYIEANMLYATAGGNTYVVKNDEKGPYIDIEVGANTDKLFIKGYDAASAVAITIAHPNDEHGLSLTSSAFISTHDFVANVQGGNGAYSVSFDFLKNGKATTVNADVTVTFIVEDTTDVKVVETTINGKVKNPEVSANGNCLVFTGNSRSTFLISVNGAELPSDSSSSAPDTSSSSSGGNETPVKKGCGGSIVASAGAIIILALGGLTVLLSKKKEDK